MRKSALLTLCFVVLASAWAQASIIDAPHNETNGIKCGSCHTYSMWWQYSPATLSDSPKYNSIVTSLCMDCHNSQGSAPTVAGHGAIAMGSNTYHNGLWEVGCTVCHNPHEQSQIYWTQSNVDPYLVTGQITTISTNTPSAGQTTVNYTGASNNPNLSVWPTNSWSDKSNSNPGRGLIFVQDKVEAVNSFSIITATATQIVIKGIINPNDISTTTCSQAPNCANANTFGLLYGQYLRDAIATPASGTRPVKFLDPKGGFVDATSTPPVGVCQVCHTLTHYWGNDGSNATHNVDTNCTACHYHSNGFKPIFPPHDAFVGKEPTCTACHTGADPVLDIHKGICTHCHTQPPALANANDRQNAIAIQRGTCFTCHGSTFTHPNASHSNISGPNCAACHDTANVVNGIHRGICITCHSSTKSAVVNTITAGKIPGSSVICEDCHTGGTNGAPAHGTTTATAAVVHDQFNASTNCSSCHVIGTAEQRLILHPACTTCHASINTTVIDTINTGKSGTAVTCDNCHAAPHNSQTDHNNRVTTGLVLNCTACHTVDTQAAIDTLHKGCATCHNYSGTKITPITVSTAINTGKGTSGTPINCEVCHGVSYGHTSATHSKVLAFDNCITCHTGANIIIDIHQKNCIGCHGSTRPEVVQAISTKNGGTCKTCHVAAHVTTVDKGTLHNIIATSDCTICHYPTLSYSPHNNLSSASYCQNCHAGTTFDDIVAIHKNDCLKCHLSTDPVKSTAIANGRINPGTPVNCETCHGANFGHPNAQHLKVTAVEKCIVCHAGTNIITDIHKSNCLGCHTSSRQEVHVAIETRVGGNCQTCHIAAHTPAVNQSSLHNIIATNNCTVCHYPTLSYSPHNNLSSASYCQNCHAGTTFDDIVAIHKNDCLKCHLSADAAKIAAISAGRVDPGTLTTCETCHGANYGHPSAQHSKVQAATECVVCHVGTSIIVDIHKSNCLNCHTSTRPEVRNAIDTRSGGTCKTCHVAAHKSVPDIGTLHVLGYPTCTDCHYPTLADKPHNNLSTVADCSGCHTSTVFTDILTIHQNNCLKCHLSGLDSVVGIIDASRTNPGTPADCKSCHTGSSGAAPAHGTTAATVAVVHDKFASSISCGSCHAVATAEQRILLHPACTTCHSSTLPAVTAAISTGRAGTTVTCEACHTGTTAGALVHGVTTPPEHFTFAASTTCAACHISGTWQERLALHPDCFTCHSSTLSAVTATITAGKAGTTISCENCHTGTTTGAPLHGTTVATVAPQHDMFNASTVCATCHNSATAEQRISLHPFCTTCHSSGLAAVAQSIATGRAGTPVNCENCHTGTTVGAPVHGTTPATVAPQHDKFAANTTCGACHISATAEQRITLHPACTTCHSSTLTSVSATITAGRAGTTVSCENCHTGTSTGAFAHGTTAATVAPQHDKFIASTTCAVCHTSATAEQRITLHPACTTCHSSPLATVSTTITAGRAGTNISCENCHTGTSTGAPVHGTTAATVAPVHDMFAASSTCGACHSSTTAEQRITLHPACTTCHSSTLNSVVTAINNGRAGTSVSCENCHTGTSTGATFHGTTPASVAPLHDKFSATSTCATCHATGIAEQRIALHPACTTCHNSSLSTVVATISAGRAGTTVNCDNCHTGTSTGAVVHGTTAATVAPVHDKFIATTTCGACHTTATAEQRITLHTACTTCHGSTLSNIVATINLGRAGTLVSCMNCHTGATTGAPIHGITASTAAPVHDKFNATTMCTSCHTGSTATERISLHPSCTTCHSSTNATVITTIANGRAGTAVECISCHTGSTANIAAFHHANPNAVAGKCTWCHVDPRDTWTTMRPGDNGSAANFPTQMACKTCHVRVSGSTIYIDKIRYSNYSSSPTRTVQHTLAGITAGTINNYGICMSCHNGTKAIRVDLFHAKPSSAASSNRYRNMSTAPGRGTFNLFWSTWHGNRDASFGTEDNKSNMNRFQNPSISFQQIAVPCASFNGCSGATTKQVPVLPAVANATLVGPGPNTTPAPETEIHVYFSTSSICGACHAASTETARTVGLHLSCDRCHGSTLTSVVNTITSGISGTAVTCENCHDGTVNGALVHGNITPESVAPLHDQLSAYPACGSCHTIGDGSFMAIYSLHRSDCATCHSSTDPTIVNTIATGKAGTAVNCTNCHGTSHHESPQAKAGDCTWCHADPRGGWSTMRPGDNGGASTLPTQLPCATCHARVVGTTLYIDKLTYTNGSYSTAPTRTVQHTFSNMTSNYIYNYGACFSCHDGSKATKANVWHAKPVSAATRNRYTAQAGVPGRGTFNVFWSTYHGSKNASFGTKSYDGNQNNFQNPATGYSFKLSVPCGSFNGCSGGSTVSVPILASQPVPTSTTTPPSGGGTTTPPPPSNQAPAAKNDSYTVTRNSSNNTFAVLANDTDPNGDALTISTVGSRSNGGSITNNISSLRYTPAHDFTGTETFTYTIRDTAGLTSTATVTVTVSSGGTGN